MTAACVGVATLQKGLAIAYPAFSELSCDRISEIEEAGGWLGSPLGVPKCSAIRSRTQMSAPDSLLTSAASPFRIVSCRVNADLNP